MKCTKTQYENGMEILVTDANLVTFTATVGSAGVVADDHGKKYVLAGALIDADGVVVTATEDTLSGTPVGVLYTNTDVTDGDQACALIVEGYVRVERVLDGYSEAAKTAVKTALPNIKFR